MSNPNSKSEMSKCNLGWLGSGWVPKFLDLACSSKVIKFRISKLFVLSISVAYILCIIFIHTYVYSYVSIWVKFRYLKLKPVLPEFHAGFKIRPEPDTSAKKTNPNFTFGRVGLYESSGFACPKFQP